MASFKFWGKGADKSATGRTPAGKQTPAEPQDSVAAMRRRARNRLVGAVVLVLVAIVGFPLLFETQPRPDATNTQVTIPSQKTTPPVQAPPAGAGAVSQSSGLDANEQVVTPGAQSATGAVGSVPQPDSAPSESAAAPATGETPSPAIATPPVSVAPATATAPTTQPQPANPPEADQAALEAKQKAAHEAAQKAEQARHEKAAAEKLAAQKAAAQKVAAQKAAAHKAALEKAAAEKAEAAKTAAAQKALSGQSASASASTEKGRFLIQIGAYADASSANSARVSAGFLGVSTYSEQVKTSSGVRTRVRAGPFASRAAADAVASKLKHGGMAAQVLPG